jgi:large subunit ribosomal protein L23
LIRTSLRPQRQEQSDSNSLTQTLSSPEFVVALVRTPFLSARYAQFRVPLNLNKLDMRDYLERAYGVGVVSIRSYVQAQPITRITRDGRNFGSWRRPKSEKRMTVELREPFVWPEAPTDLTRYVSPPAKTVENIH